eukprot:5190531-Prymnesium_polylepis.1
MVLRNSRSTESLPLLAAVRAFAIWSKNLVLAGLAVTQPAAQRSFSPRVASRDGGGRFCSAPPRR